MKISIFTNYLNDHQLPIALAFRAMDDVEFAFVSLSANESSIGRANLNDEHPFVVRAYDGESGAREAMRHAIEDDIVVFQHMDRREEYVRARARAGKPFFRASERLLKRGNWWRWAPPKMYRTWNWFTRYKHAEMRVLCVGGFVAGDLMRFGFPIDSCLKWAYFPRIEPMCTSERDFSLARGVTICSVQNLIPCKRVDLQIKLAKRLKDAGVTFRLDIAGDGPERESLEALAKELDVASEVRFLGALSREDVAALMCGSHLCLATSNRKEGWGCAVNEAMACGCILVASDAIGSVPFLVEDGVNGFKFKSESLDDLFEKVSSLLSAPDQLARISGNAVATVNDVWCAQVAVERFVEYSKAWLRGDSVAYAFGPMSPCSAGERK